MRSLCISNYEKEVTIAYSSSGVAEVNSGRIICLECKTIICL